MNDRRLAGAAFLLAGLLTSAASRAVETPQKAEEKAAASTSTESSAAKKTEAGKSAGTTAKPGVATPAAATRVALTTAISSTHSTLKPDFANKPGAKGSSATPVVLTEAEEDPVTRALRTIHGCKARFAEVNDYTCTFYKRELVKGSMTPQFVMDMKARTTPRSIYFKFQDPHRGREAIYVEGRNANKILAHDVGITKFLAGTMTLDLDSPRAMEHNRHPISHAGIGNLIDTVVRHWEAELRPDETILLFNDQMAIGDRGCLLIESIHPHRQPHFQYHKVRIFIDSELNLPIRFEAYDWPRQKGAAPNLVEEYSYIGLKLNVGLEDVDFDVNNQSYAFGRF